ncbi:MAG: ribose-5-phosphate isomerase RpiA [Candidatus Heimdallarchaeaceae archaeon]
MKTDTNDIIQQEKNKRIAALKVIENFIYDGFIVGVGTGSTVKYLIHSIADLIEKNELDIILIPSSIGTELELNRNGLSFSSLIEFPEIDVYVDSADIVTRDYSLIKGGGGALTMEKIMARAAQEFIVIIDDSKYPRDILSFPVPVEVIPKALNTIIKPIFELGGNFKTRLASMKYGPIISDNGNIIGDITFKKKFDPQEMEQKLNNIPGIVENGIFPSDAHRIIIGKEKAAEIIDVK